MLVKDWAKKKAHARKRIAKRNKDFKSNFEAQLAEKLKESSVEFCYEREPITYQRECKYTPDFFLNNGVILEAKGYFSSEDRSKHLLIRKQRPDLDIRFIFQKPNTRLSKKSKTTYAVWCEKHGFLWCTVDSMPLTWLI